MTLLTMPLRAIWSSKGSGPGSKDQGGAGAGRWGRGWARPSLSRRQVGVLGLRPGRRFALKLSARSATRAGAPKTEGAARFVSAINPHVRFTAHPEWIDEDNAASIIGGYDLVLEGTDSFPTKRLLAQACAVAKIPLVTGSLGQFDGALTVLMPYRDNNPGFADLYPQDPLPRTAPCARGRAQRAAGVLGTMMANEALN